MSNVRKCKPSDYIADSYDSLVDGDSDRGNLNRGCYRMEVLGDSPSGCDLHVKREGDILKYNCFAASCPCAGSVRIGKGAGRSSGTGGGLRTTRRVSRADARVLEARRLLRGSVRHLPKLCLEYLARNNISRADAENAGVLWNELEGALVFPIRKAGLQEELLVRKIGERSPSEKKWLNYVDSGTVYIINGSGMDVLLLVEAPTSAISLAGAFNISSLATLGTNICDGKLKNIVDIASQYQHVFFLPDGDVDREKTRQIKKRLTKAGINIIVRRVETKPRYELEHIERFINEAQEKDGME